MSLVFKKVNKKFLKLNIKEDKKYTSIKKSICNVFLPFGLEEFKNNYMFNFELDTKKNIEFINLVNLLEDKIKDIMPNRKLKKIFRKTEKKNKVLCKGNIKKTKNVIITKLIENNNEIPIFNLKNKYTYVNIYLEISIFGFMKNYGLYINLLQIKLI